MICAAEFAQPCFFFPAASKLDASESASEHEEDFELISDEELRSATNEEDENEGDDRK